jgi:hypothetical protein
MSKRLLNKEEQKELRENSNVRYCSDKSITFTTKFKEKALGQYAAGLTATEIFKQSELSLKLIGKDVPNDCLRRWRKIHKEKGIRGLSEARGSNSSGRPKKQKLTEAERLKYLEAEVKYLKAENSFLVALRAKKTE